MSEPLSPQPSLLGLTLEQLTAVFQEMGEPGFRAKQVMEWVFKRRVLSIDQMTNLGAALRAKLAERFTLRTISSGSSRMRIKAFGFGSDLLIFFSGS